MLASLAFFLPKLSPTGEPVCTGFHRFTFFVKRDWGYLFSVKHDLSFYSFMIRDSQF